MTIMAAANSGWERRSVGLDLVGKILNKLFVRGLAIYLGEHLVLEVGVLDTWNATQQHGWRSRNN